MDSVSECTSSPIVRGNRPRTRIDGPAQNGTESRLSIVKSTGVARIDSGGKCSPTATQNGHQERDNRRAALRGWRSRLGAGANRMGTSAGLPEKPTLQGKPGDMLTQARWFGW